MVIAERRRAAAIKLGAIAGGLALAGLVLIGIAVAGGRDDVPKKTTVAVSAEQTAIEPAVESQPEPVPAAPEEQPLPEQLTEEGAAAPVPAPEPKPDPKPDPAPVVQRASIKIGSLGYEPATLELKAGSPIELTVAKGEGCAAGFAFPQLGVSADNSRGPAKVKLGPLKPGTYTFTCGMAMVEGRLVIS